MKNFLLAGFCLFFGARSVFSANISDGGAQGADGGLLQVDQTDQYWWFCVQPDGSRSPLSAGPAGYNADVVTLDYGWTRQTTERFAYSNDASTPQERKDDLPTQVNVIEYVLDAYLPWSDTTGRFLEFNGNTPQTADVPFLNRLYASQQYIKKLYDRLTEPVFSDLSVFNPVNPFAVDSAANTARHNFFDQIKADVNTRDAANFFANYDAAHSYAIANTFYNQAVNPATWTGQPDFQDALIIGAAVPEPAINLLTFGSIMALGMRRRRSRILPAGL